MKPHCTLCEAELTKANQSRDPEFCRRCYLRTGEVQMERSRAARAFLETRHGMSGSEHRRAEMLTFLYIFHPDMPMDRKVELSCDAAQPTTTHGQIW